jgi:hypothetical protein
MHLHLPKKLHGWREFFKEIGIIVLGVLIALGAEQLVETWHWNRETAEAREALTSELDRNLGRILFMSGQDTCADRRLGEIEKWLKSYRTGQPIPLNDNVSARPIFMMTGSSIWEVVKTGQVAAHMPLADKLAYARIYDVLKSADANLTTQMAAWSSLEELYGAHQLDDQTIQRGLAKVTAIRYNRTANSRLLKALAAEIRTLGLNPDNVPNPDETRVARLCAPAL